ncbi:hypothetical protein HOL34_03505 [bacterium]|jgi:hypothetical protein|nr:hypothetical protein [bacterium]MBT3903869.1 hypothetical protein [bacterium]MBT4577633.1 hypothetical protein [bacterium]MBT5346202.1 hypothetical protein [bacterium]MBT6130998.1 hypothetical protein [bacterium]
MKKVVLSLVLLIPAIQFAGPMTSMEDRLSTAKSEVTLEESAAQDAQTATREITFDQISGIAVELDAVPTLGADPALWEAVVARAQTMNSLSSFTQDAKDQDPIDYIADSLYQMMTSASSFLKMNLALVDVAAQAEVAAQSDSTLSPQESTESFEQSQLTPSVDEQATSLLVPNLSERDLSALDVKASDIDLVQVGILLERPEGMTTESWGVVIQHAAGILNLRSQEGADEQDLRFVVDSLVKMMNSVQTRLVVNLHKVAAQAVSEELEAVEVVGLEEVVA